MQIYLIPICLLQSIVPNIEKRNVISAGLQTECIYSHDSASSVFYIQGVFARHILTTADKNRPLSGSQSGDFCTSKHPCAFTSLYMLKPMKPCKL